MSSNEPSTGTSLFTAFFILLGCACLGVSLLRVLSSGDGCYDFPLFFGSPHGVCLQRTEAAGTVGTAAAVAGLAFMAAAIAVAISGRPATAVTVPVPAPMPYPQGPPPQGWAPPQNQLPPPQGWPASGPPVTSGPPAGQPTDGGQYPAPGQNQVP